ncbi:MAG TPA: septation regulator SpoVG [Vicinamibacteria bacterium]|jgi:stage V sporulation protein G
MEITEVRIFPVDDDKLKAFVSIILDDCFVISDIKIIHGPKGLFVSMPSKKRKDGTFRDIAHPLNSDTRRMMEDQILARYRNEVGQAARLEPRILGEGALAQDTPRRSATPPGPPPGGISEV